MRVALSHLPGPISISGIISPSFLPPVNQRKEKNSGHEFLRSSPNILNKAQHVAEAERSQTFVYERNSALLVFSVRSGVVAGRIWVDHEVGLLPAVLLQSPTEFFVAPHFLQNQTGSTYFSVRVSTGFSRRGKKGGEREKCKRIEHKQLLFVPNYFNLLIWITRPY